MNFTALDFETANGMRTSICSVGMVRVEDGKVVESVHQLIKPDSPFNSFNTAIHGISAFDVRSAPRFAEYWDEMRPFLTDVVVAHNAAFDISCLKASVDFYGLEPPSFEYLCTLCISRKTCSLPSHKLDALVRHYGLESFRHHNALDDALACARLFQVLSEKTDVSSMKKPFGAPPKKKAAPSRPKPRIEEIRKTIIIEERREAKISFCQDTFFNELNLIGVPQTKPERPAPSVQASPQQDLVFDYSPIDFSKSFVVSGKFEELSRRDVEGLILYKGGKVQRGVNFETDYVVVGSRRSPSWKYNEYGAKIDAALEIGRAAFITEEHFLKEVL